MEPDVVRIYDLILRHLGIARAATNDLIEVYQDQILDIENNPTPVPEDLKEATQISEKAMNHIMAAKYMEDAFNALNFYRAATKGLVDEEDEEFIADEDAENSDEVDDVPSDSDEPEDEVTDSGIIYLHNFPKK